MAQKPEARFVTSVNRYLPKRVYTEGMANPYRGGTPDSYYESVSNQIWIEYKWVSRIPKELNLTHSKSKPCLSQLQQRWLRRAHENGVPIAVIVGHRNGGIILPGLTWDTTLTKEDFEKLSKTRKEIAEWITHHTVHRG